MFENEGSSVIHLIDEALGGPPRPVILLPGHKLLSIASPRTYLLLPCGRAPTPTDWHKNAAELTAPVNLCGAPLAL